MKNKIKICVLHGAISNGGDFLIYKRGRKLLEKFLNDYFNFTYKLRSLPINGDFDGIILLGGPLITRRLHKQSKNIIKYVKNKRVPIFCLSLGISGKNLKSYKNYFWDNESICFWKYVYETSKLFSVRDMDSYNMLRNYGINTELTGCSALFDLHNIEKKNRISKLKKIAVTVPNFLFPSPKSILSFSFSFLKTIYFLYLLSRKIKNKEIVVFFQHGYGGFNIFTKIFANMLGFKSSDMSRKSIEDSNINNFDIHIGTRLHTHIYFLSSNKPSFLLSVGARTESFLKTIKTPNNQYTILGIKNLVNLLIKKIKKNNFDEFGNVYNKIMEHYVVMKKFLNKIKWFYKEKRIYG